MRRFVVEQRMPGRQVRLEQFQKTGRIDQRSEPADIQREETFPRRQASAHPKRLLDVLLLLIEIAAVGGLVFILFKGINALKDLNQQALAVIAQPTLSPTPLINAVVLPSGHTPPDGGNGASPNEAEIPAHLRPLVQSLAGLPLPTPGPEQAIRIQIPALGVDAPIVQGDSWEQLKKGAGQHHPSADPGITGNVVLSAHNDIFGEIFRDLDRLQPGDEIILYTIQRNFTYIITGTTITQPTDVSVMEATANPTVTLISCYPYRVDDKRIVVSAKMEEK